MKRCGLILAVIFASLVAMASPAMAQFSDAARCSATLPEGETAAAWLAKRPVWTCPTDFSELSTAGHAVQFRWNRDAGEQPPSYLISRTAAFHSLIIFARTEAGGWQSATHPFSQIKAAHLERQFAVPLKGLSLDADELVVVITEPSQAIPLDYLHLAASMPGNSPEEFGALLIIALVCGLILMPLLFDFIFWRVLREPFILWHAVFVVMMALQLILTAGLYLPFLSFGLDMLRIGTVGSFGAMVAACFMFISAFLEEDALTNRMRRLLMVGAALMVAATLLHAPGFTSLDGWPSRIFYANGIPVACILVCAVTQAWRRGSRYIRYIVIGLAPLFVVSLVRVVTFLLPGVPTNDFNSLFLIGVLTEASATALGVAARFVQLKRERDLARSEAQTLEDLAGRDPLTGLLNRRSIEPRFFELHRSGYETIAILDLDHFKQINDTFGHAKGDAVLRAVAGALKSDDNVLAMRIGGEEFLLLVQGDDGLERAERLRQAIPTRVAREVDKLDGPVTASMGVVCVPPGAMPKANFSDFYEMADKLLYEAKEQGRNRHVAERLRAFRKRANDRRTRPAVV